MLPGHDHTKFFVSLHLLPAASAGSGSNRQAFKGCFGSVPGFEQGFIAAGIEDAGIATFFLFFTLMSKFVTIIPISEFGEKEKKHKKAEEPVKESLMLTDGKNYKKSAYGTISYLPATFGAVVASVAIRDLLEKG